MTVIPFAVNETEYSVYIGLDDQAWERLKAYDPGELVLEKLSQPWINMKLKGVLFGYCSDSDLLECQRISQQTDDIQAVLKYLSRGWRFEPDAGDHDGPPLSVRINPTDTKH